MEENQYKIWWELHRRVAKGETLSEEERSVYEAGRAELQAEEWANLREPSMNIQSLRERWRQLTERSQQLAREETALRELAAQLEQQYLALTGESLGLGV
jgi:hypothetical protein